MTGIHSVILAGGQGTRFWPVSRASLPKQFLSIEEGSPSLIKKTTLRALKLSDPDSIWSVTSDALAPLVAEHVPESRIISEPIAKNTAASIGLSAIHIAHVDPNAVMVVMPSDHAIKNEDALIDVLRLSAKVARSIPVLVTIGIAPESPHTGFGYIKKGKAIPGFDGVYSVQRFFEKPNLERAIEYVKSGDFFWNSGMFVWSVQSILDAIHDELPDLYEGLIEIKSVIGTPKEKEVTQKVFNALEGVSIDIGVLEHVKNTVVVPASEFGWNDVGAWDAWAEYFDVDADNNRTQGDVSLIESSGCVVRSHGPHVAVLGAEDLVVITSSDAILVCPKNKVQDVRKIVDNLKKKNRTELI